MLALLADRGAVTFSSDEAVHRVYRRPEVAEALGARYGDGVVGGDGVVDRHELAARVAGDREELAWLEGLVHPLVAQEFREVARQAPAGSVVVSEIPLLAETGSAELFDLVVSVEAPYEVRAGRSAPRMGDETFAGLDGRQATKAERTAVSDMSFVNDGEIAGLRAFADRVYERAREVGGNKSEE